MHTPRLADGSFHSHIHTMCANCTAHFAQKAFTRACIAEDKHDRFLAAVAPTPETLEALKSKHLRPRLTAQQIQKCGVVFVLQHPGQILATLPVRLDTYVSPHSTAARHPPRYP